MDMLFVQQVNKSSMLKKGLLTNLDVALSAVQLEKQKTEPKVAAAMLVKNDKCSQLFALLVKKKPLFLSNRLRTDLFIAANAMYPQHVTTFRSFNVETFPGLCSWEVFLWLGREVRF